jgi:aspartyl-tRNA(Asn)/glutamyl-tRNA(Gln) amidotransferase subunit A
VTGDGRTLRATIDAIATGRRSARDEVDAALGRIADIDGESGLNAFLAVGAAPALAAADSIDRTRAATGARPALAGVPIGIKDNICTPWLPTTCGSRMLEGFVPPYEATAVRRLRAAGAIVVGKTNLDEFAMGSSTENSAFGPTRNPRDRTRVPGGSSGGSAAAVAAGLVPIALGSETGGSVRQPAAFCGCVGMKPSYGRVSRYGLVAFASSLDQIGVFGRTVADAALVLDTIAGHDPRDATSARLVMPPLTAAAAAQRSSWVVGVPREYFPAELDPRVRAACSAALERWRAAGAEIREVSLPHTSYAIATYYIIATAEASSNLARYDAVRYGPRRDGEVYDAARSVGFGTEVKRRIVLGTFVLSAGYYDEYYGRAQRVRQLIADDFRRVFADGIDVLFTPTTPTPAFRLGEKIADPYAMYLSDVFTVTANLAGLPAISVPIGEPTALPIGGQLIAARWREDTLVGAAATLERAVAR